MNTHPTGDSFPSDPPTDFGFAAHGADPFGQSPYDTYGAGDHHATGYAQHQSAVYDSVAQPDVGLPYGTTTAAQGGFPASDPYADPYGAAPYGPPAYPTVVNGPYDSDGYGTYAAYGMQGGDPAHHAHLSAGYDAGPAWDGAGQLTEHPDHGHLQGAIPRQYAPTDHASTNYASADFGFDGSSATDAPGRWEQGGQWGPGEPWNQGGQWGYWDSGDHASGGWDNGGHTTSGWHSGAWDSGAWDGDGWGADGHTAYGHPDHPQDTPAAAYVAYDNTAQGQGFWHPDTYGAAGAEAAAYGAVAGTPGETYDQGAYVPFLTEQQPYQQPPFQQAPEQPGFTMEQGQPPYGGGTFEQYSEAAGSYAGQSYETYEAELLATMDGSGPLYPSPAPQGAYEPQADLEEPEAGAEVFASDPDLRQETEPEPVAAAVSPESECRSRRRSPKRHSALMTVAAPSIAVLGVAGIAAASVSTTDSPSDSDADSTTQASAADSQSVKRSPANSKLDTQLAGLSEDADDFANRASRTQERIDLKKRKEAERKKKAAEAARKEAMRPKFVEPVSGSGISAQYGQAGVNWMSLHSGIDFPVSFGTAVKAATDGTVTTKYDVSFGNMVIVTAEDGTETWYCHLSSTKIRSGTVKAGDVIAYSGNSGNSTGPHLHFEVHPGGGSAIDPLPWFRSHGVEPG